MRKGSGRWNSFLCCVATRVCSVPHCWHQQFQTSTSHNVGERTERAIAEVSRILISAVSDSLGNDVFNAQDEDLGDIKEIMLDMRSGRVAYAVLSFGGFLGMGEKLFAVPWAALTLDTVNKRFVLDASKDRLESAPGFEKDNWPDMADTSWEKGIHDYYGTKPYTEPRLG